ncbi:MAG: hypothetical protein WCS17_13835 [Prevotella sp.]
MTPFIDLVRESGPFQAMITLLQPLMTQPQYSKYFTPTFNETRDWKGIEKEVGRVPVASFVADHGDKPIVSLDKMDFTYGVLPSWGDQYPMSSEELIELQRLENYIKSNVVGINGTPADPILVDQLTDQRKEMLVKRFDPIARMPLAAMDKIAFEEWSNGTATIDSTKNAPKVGLNIDFQIKKYHVQTVWSDTENANALKDIDAFVNKVWKDLHIRIDTLALNPDEVRKILSQKSTRDVVSTYITTGNRQTKMTGIPSSDEVNLILQGQYKIPALTVIDAVVDIRGAGGNIAVPSDSFNAFKDGRVSASIGTNLGKYMYTLSPMQRMPDNSYSYATSAGNVLISAKSSEGQLDIKSDLCALPVITVRKSMAILVTDDTTTGSSLY